MLRRLVAAALILGAAACAGQGAGGPDPAADATFAPPIDGLGGPDADPIAPDAADTGPRVDRTDPRLHETTFRASEAESGATQGDGLESAHLDTRVAPLGRLVVYLHGAGTPADGAECGSRELTTLIAGWGFHALNVCYVAGYGVENCGDDIAACRLEAFDGTDRSPALDVAPPDTIERRIVMALDHLQTADPGGDWGYFLDGTAPRWSKIVISGISHGASTAALIGQVRDVLRVVSLSGPYDPGQAWLTRDGGLTPAGRYWGFSHTADAQHSGHLAAFEALGLPGAPTSVDGASAPYGGSHRLITSAASTSGHASTQAGDASPTNGDGTYTFVPVWRTLYGSP